MQTDGWTLRQHGTLRLVALRAGATEERYVLMQDDRIVAGGFPSLAAAGARFERRQRETLRGPAQSLPEAPEERAPAQPIAAPADAVSQAESGEPDNVVSLEAYRRRCP